MEVVEIVRGRGWGDEEPPEDPAPWDGRKRLERIATQAAKARAKEIDLVPLLEASLEMVRQRNQNEQKRKGDK